MYESKQPNLVTKITLKTVGVQPKPGTMKSEDPPRALAAFYGRCTKTDVTTSNYGESTRFHGSFEAVNAETGELYRSGKIFLPSVVESLLADAVTAGDGNPVDFAMEIGVKPANTATGYEYTVKPLTPIAVSDDLALLRQAAATASFAGNLLAHEKPEPETAEDKDKGKAKSK